MWAFLLVALFSILGCAEAPPAVEALRFSQLAPQPLRLAEAGPSLTWPQHLEPLETDFLWLEDHRLFRVSFPPGGTATPQPVLREEARKMDALVALTSNGEGRFAVVDSSGRILVTTPDGKATRFETDLPSRVGSVAQSDDGSLYLLLQDRLFSRPAVAVVGPQGDLVTQLGAMGPGGAVQVNMKGGGIAVCPDGRAYYSYVTSPRIRRIEAGTFDLGYVPGESPDFDHPSEGDVRRALKEIEETRTARPIIELALRSSRVSSLLCDSGGTLFRQVIHPSGEGSTVEAWDPDVGRIGTLDAGSLMLLGVRDRTLYLGRSDDRQFVLERIRYERVEEVSSD